MMSRIAAGIWDWEDGLGCRAGKQTALQGQQKQISEEKAELVKWIKKCIVKLAQLFGVSLSPLQGVRLRRSCCFLQFSLGTRKGPRAGSRRSRRDTSPKGGEMLFHFTYTKEQTGWHETTTSW